MRLARDEAARLYKRARVRKARRYLREFVRDAWPQLEPGVDPSAEERKAAGIEASADDAWNWHLDAICDHVQCVLEGWLVSTGRMRPEARAVFPHAPIVQNLLINAAPATLKSKIVMVFAPAWMWLLCPKWTVAAFSGNPDNVARDSNACRDLVTSEWYRKSFGVAWEIRRDVDAVGKWQTTEGGERTSRGLNAGKVGLHVDAIFLDDPDDAYHVYGEAARKETRGHWGALGNRVNSLEHSVRIVVQQRMHVEDLTSFILGEEGAWSPANPRGWAQLAIAVEFDPRFAGRTVFGWADPREAKNENVHPARFTRAVLAGERRRLGMGYEAQYNQRPESLEGGMFKRAWLRFWKRDGINGNDLLARPHGCRTREELPAVALPAPDWIDLSLDGTFGSTTATASRVGLLAVLGRGADRFVIRDRTRRMTGVNEMVKACIDLLEAHPTVKKIVVEKKALGAAVVEKLQDLLREARWHGVAVVEVDPKGDSKESRAAAIQPDVQNGNLYVEDGAEWLESGEDPDDPGFVGELCSFPNGKHDDRVDTLSQLMRDRATSKDVGRLKMLLGACR